jgi:hypothetical protein
MSDLPQVICTGCFLFPNKNLSVCLSHLAGKGGVCHDGLLLVAVGVRKVSVI